MGKSGRAPSHALTKLKHSSSWITDTDGKLSHHPERTKSKAPPSYKQYLKNTKGKYRGGKRGENFKRARADYKRIYGR